MLNYEITVTNSLVAQTGAAAATVNGVGIDTSGLDMVWVHVNAPVATTADTITFTVEHSESLSTGYTAVAAATLVSQSTGAAATFTVVTDAVAVDQTLQLIKDVLKRYVRIVATVAGGTITTYFCGEIIGIPKYTS